MVVAVTAVPVIMVIMAVMVVPMIAMTMLVRVIVVMGMVMMMIVIRHAPYVIHRARPRQGAPCRACA